jgi:MFS family permease
VCFAAFFYIENHVDAPMFNLQLFRIRAFFMGSSAGLLTAIARGGLQFMLIIWLQGIWLPLHGYSYADTPLWAGICLLPLTFGFLAAGPISGYFSDRHGARVLSTTGLLIFAASFAGLLFLAPDFTYWEFAVIVGLNGVGGGMFAAPNSAAVMNSVPADQRGGAAGIQAAFMNTGMVLSTGIFFSLMIVGLTNTLPAAMARGLTHAGVGASTASVIAKTPVVGSLFSSFLGYNPLKSLLSETHSRVSQATFTHVTSKSFFPNLIKSPFHHGLEIVFAVAIGISLIAALFSALRGERYIHPSPSSALSHEAQLAESSGAVPGEIAVDAEVVR